MCSLRELRIDIANKYQLKTMLIILEQNYPKTMKVISVLVGLLSLPLKILGWVLIGLFYLVEGVLYLFDKVSDGITWLLDDILKELLLLFYAGVTILVYKIALRRKRRKG